jgi:hypothetical protein
MFHNQLGKGLYKLGPLNGAVNGDVSKHFMFHEMEHLDLCHLCCAGRRSHLLKTHFSLHHSSILNRVTGHEPGELNSKLKKSEITIFHTPDHDCEKLRKLEYRELIQFSSDRMCISSLEKEVFGPLRI